VADAFQSVIGATEEKEASILTARAAAIKTETLTKADAAKVGAEAAAYAVRRTAIAAAEADRFQVQLQTHRQSPAVFTSRLYLGTLADALRGVRKYVVAVDPATEVLIFNYEENVQPNLLDFGPAARPVAGGGGR